VVLGLDRLADAEGALVRRMMQVAADLGVSHVDTGAAGSRGQAHFRAGSEPALVQRFSVITRIGAGSAEAIEHAMNRAFAGLGRRHSDVVVVDGLAAAQAVAGAAWRRLCAHQEVGEVNRVGVRVQTPDELSEALALPGLGYLELPVPAQGLPWWAEGPAASAIAAAADASGGESASGVIVCVYAPDPREECAPQRMLSLPWVTCALATPADEQELRNATRLDPAS
jgi:spore coat polysaccharide biosynthesis protein SpsF